MRIIIRTNKEKRKIVTRMIAIRIISRTSEDKPKNISGYACNAYVIKGKKTENSSTPRIAL